MSTGHTESSTESSVCGHFSFVQVSIVFLLNGCRNQILPLSYLSWGSWCHLKRAVCTAFLYPSILHTPVFSLWVTFFPTLFPTLLLIFVKKILVFFWEKKCILQGKYKKRKNLTKKITTEEAWSSKSYAATGELVLLWRWVILCVLLCVSEYVCITKPFGKMEQNLAC